MAFATILLVTPSDSPEAEDQCLSCIKMEMWVSGARTFTWKWKDYLRWCWRLDTGASILSCSWDGYAVCHERCNSGSLFIRRWHCQKWSLPIIADAWDCLLNRLKNGGLSQFRRMKKIDGKYSNRQGIAWRKNKLRELEKELKRKDKALAEAAALLILREKFNALWDNSEEDCPSHGAA